MFSTMNKVGGNHTNNSKVYLIQEIPGTSQGMPKYNIMGAKRYGDLVTLLPCLLYTSPSPRDGLLSRMPSSA